MHYARANFEEIQGEQDPLASHIFVARRQYRSTRTDGSVAITTTPPELATDLWRRWISRVAVNPTLTRRRHRWSPPTSYPRCRDCRARVV